MCSFARAASPACAISGACDSCAACAIKAICADGVSGAECTNHSDSVKDRGQRHHVRHKWHKRANAARKGGSVKRWNHFALTALPKPCRNQLEAPKCANGNCTQGLERPKVAQRYLTLRAPRSNEKLEPQGAALAGSSRKLCHCLSQLKRRMK